ncbi:MAG: efflux RND transporter periplasmic adaptor subunit [Desulfococcaceae bacterium]
MILERYLIPPILLLAAFSLAACENADGETTELPPKTVAWIQLESGNGQVNRRLSGIVAPADKAELSFEVAGKVETVNVELGETFQKDDVLATLDDRTYALTVRQREGALSEARARFEEARNDFRRKRNLVEAGAVSQADFDLSKAAYEAARNQVTVAEARLDLAKEDLADARLTAPYDGSVSSRQIEPSQRVSPGQPALEIQGDQKLEVAVSVPETLVGRLQVGGRKTVEFPARPDLEVSAEIVEIGARAENANAFPVTLALSEPLSGLRPGMTAEVDFAMDGENGNGAPAERAESWFPIPVTAFEAAEGEDHYVFRYDPETETIAAQPVTIAHLSGPHGYVSRGLSAGDIIVKAGLPFLRDGQRVTLLNRDVQTFNE